MDKMYVTICVDCSNDMKGNAIGTANRIVKAFMKSVLAQQKLSNAAEYMFTGCKTSTLQQFCRLEDMNRMNWQTRMKMETENYQITADLVKELIYPVFSAVDNNRNLSSVIGRVHESQIKKMEKSRNFGDALYNGLLLVIADGGAGLEHTGPDETAASKKLAAYCTGHMAEKCHIVPVLIDLHGNAVNNRLKQLAAGFPDGYVRLGPAGRDEGDLCRCFSAILAAVNQSISSKNRREQVNAAVVRELKKLKNA